MARIIFDSSEDNYLEIKKDSGKIIIILASRSPDNARKLTLTSVEVEEEKFFNLVKELD